MRIATWNVNGLRARLDYLLHWLEARSPDVVGLQELKLTDDQFPATELEAVGYHSAVHGQKGWNGVAVLARESPEIVQVGLPGQEDFGARLITTDVAGIRFTTVYCPNGKHTGHDDYPRKLAWFEALESHLAASSGPDRAAVLCGDFNICPAAIDSWNEALLAGSIHHTAEERRRFQLLLDGGLVDLFRQQQPQAVAYSWWDYRGGAFHRNQGLRIDFVLGTRPVATRLRAARIDRDYRKKKDGLTASDHAPVIVDLE